MPDAHGGTGPRLVTAARDAASSADAAARRRHPLEDSDHLAWQATTAVRLLERFGAQLLVALDAVGRSDDPALDAALLERDRLVAQLEPLLAALAEARARVRDWPAAPPVGGGDSASQHALSLILAPVDDALQHAQLLHKRLSDETREVLERRTRPPAPVRRGGRGGAVALVR